MKITVGVVLVQMVLRAHGCRGNAQSEASVPGPREKGSSQRYEVLNDIHKSLTSTDSSAGFPVVTESPQSADTAWDSIRGESSQQYDVLNDIPRLVPSTISSAGAPVVDESPQSSDTPWDSKGGESSQQNEVLNDILKLPISTGSPTDVAVPTESSQSADTVSDSKGEESSQRHEVLNNILKHLTITGYSVKVPVAPGTLQSADIVWDSNETAPSQRYGVLKDTPQSMINTGSPAVTAIATEVVPDNALHKDRRTSTTNYKNLFTFLMSPGEKVPPEVMDSVCSLLVDSRGLKSAISTSLGQECNTCSTSPDLIAFVAFLLTPATGGSIILVHDDSHSSMVPWMKACHALGLGVSVSRHEVFLLQMTSVLKSSHRRILLFCSKINEKKIFQKVKERALESRVAQWYIIDYNGPTKELEQHLREGTQAVATVRNDSSCSYDLFASRVDPDGVLRFRNIGTWTAHGGIPTYNLREPIFPLLTKLYHDLQGRTLTSAYVLSPPFTISEDPPAGGEIPHDEGEHLTGIDIEVLKALSSTMNFTYRMVVPEDRTWGNPNPDGKITGMIGMAARHETHLVISDVTITALRDSVIDYSQPYTYSQLHFYSKAPEIRSRAWAMFDPFPTMVWIYLVITTLIMGVTANVIMRVNIGQPWRPLKPIDDVMLNTFRSIVTQSNQLPVQDSALRILFSLWYVFSFVVGVILASGGWVNTSSPKLFILLGSTFHPQRDIIRIIICNRVLYSGTLMTYLLVPVYEKPIDTVEDLLEATKTRGYFLALMKDTSSEARVKVLIYNALYDSIVYSKSSIMKEVYATETKVLADSNGFDKILTEKAVAVGGKTNMHYLMTPIGIHRYHTSREAFAGQNYGVVTPSGAPYLPRINEVVDRLVEAGLVKKWVKDEFWKAQTKNKRQDGDSEGLKAMGMDHLLSAFLLLLLGLGVSFLTLVTELMISSRSHARRTEERSYGAGVSESSSVYPDTFADPAHSANPETPVNLGM